MIRVCPLRPPTAAKRERLSAAHDSPCFGPRSRAHNLSPWMGYGIVQGTPTVGTSSFRSNRNQKGVERLPAAVESARASTQVMRPLLGARYPSCRGVQHIVRVQGQTLNRVHTVLTGLLVVL